MHADDRGDAPTSTSSSKSTDRQFHYFCVAFIDILGQQDAFAGVQGLPQSEVEKARLGEALRNSVGIVETLRDGFATFYEQFEKPSSLLEKVKPELRAMFQEIRRATVKYYSFSDLFIAQVPLRATGNQCAAVNGVFRVFLAGGSMMLISLAEKHALRGAIEVGTGTLLKTGEVYGPVLNHTYGLERNIAGYPRIVIGHDAISYLTTYSRTDPTDVYQRVCKMVADLCLTFISVDTDGVPILDYLSPAFKEAIGKNHLGEAGGLDLDAVIAKAYRFVQSEHQRHYARQDLKLFHRYRQLESYFQARMK